MISDNQTNTVYFSALLNTDKRFSTFCDELTGILQKHNINYKFLENTNDIWCRDYMPVQVSKNKFIEYRYDPDYLQSKKDRKLKSYPDLIIDALDIRTEKTDIILDGGNVIKFGNKVFMTDKIIPENSPKYLKDRLLKRLEDLFEATIILIPWLHDEDSSQDYCHADGMVRFVDGNTVLIDSYLANEKESVSIGEKFRSILKKNQIDYIPLQFSIPYSRQNDKNWGYVNFLQMKDLLLIPVFGIEEDKEAIEQFHQLFPSYSFKSQIQTIDSRAIIKHGGVLNCISWNVLE